MTEKKLEDFEIGDRVRLLEDHVGVMEGTIGTVSAYSKTSYLHQLVVEFPGQEGLIYCSLDVVEAVE